MFSLTSRRGSRAPSTPFGPLSTVRYSVDGVSFDMVRVPPGRFLDGEGEARRELLVSRPFEIGATLVTQALWRAVMGSSPSLFRGEDRPVEEVSWLDAQRLMAALAVRGLPGFRLPTEAEWAWAAHCGVPTRWAGADRAKVVAVVGVRQTAAVAGLSDSAVGALDFSGNLWEWVADWFVSVPPGGVDVNGPGRGAYRVSRGSSWGDDLADTHVANRYMDVTDACRGYLGVRLLRVAP